MNVLDKLLFNLNTIAGICKGQKISTAREFISLDDDSALLQSFWRWKAGDDREKNVQTICKDVRTVIAICGYILESHHLYATDDKYAERVDDVKKIRLGLNGAIIGINNLCQTYIGDTNILAQLNPLGREVCDCLNNITAALLHLGISQ